MSDHDFEKRVQQKMDELKFTPSDAVWKAVEQEIRKDRPRRRGWVFIPLGLIALGVAGYFYFNASQSADLVAKGSGAGTSMAQQDKTGSAPVPPGQEDLPAGTSTQGTTEQPISAQGTSEQKTSQQKRSEQGTPEQIASGEKTSNEGTSEQKRSEQKKSEQKKSEQKKSQQELSKDITSPQGRSKEQTPGKKSSSGERSEQATPKGEIGQSSGLPEKPPVNKPSARKPFVKNSNQPDGEVVKNYAAANNSSKEIPNEKSGTRLSSNNESPIIAGSQNSTAIKDSSLKPSSLSPGARDSAEEDLVKSSSGADSNAIGDQYAQHKPDSNQLAGQTLIKSKKKRAPWEWGLVVSGGISNTSEGPISGVLKSSPTADALSSSPAGSNYVFAPVTAGLPPARPSKVKAGPYFTIGGFVNKQLSPRFSFSTGLQYSQYTTIIEIGYRVDSSRLVNNGSQVMNVARYYRADDNSKFSNRYHFIELPLSMNFRITGAKALPLFWQAGIRISQMVSSDALLFDSGTGVYYKDNSAFHKTQFGFFTGISVGLFGKTKTPVLVGPSVKYNTTGMFGKEISGNKHLMSAGLDLRMFLNKR